MMKYYEDILMELQHNQFPDITNSIVSYIVSFGVFFARGRSC